MRKIGIVKKELYVKSFAVISILALFLLIVITVENILVSFVMAFVINYILAPVVNAVERTGVSRKITVSGLFLIITVLFGMGLYVLFPILIEQLSSFRDELPKFVEGITKFIAATEQKFNFALSSFYKIDVSSKVASGLSGFSNRIFEDLPALISSSIAVLILAPFFAFFMLLDGQMITKKLLSLVPNNFFELALNLQHRMNAQLGDFIRARLLEAAIVGFVVWAGLEIIDFPYAALLGIFAGLTNLIPYIGPVIGAIPAILIALIHGISGFGFLILIIVYLIGQLIDAFFIIPLVVAKIVDLHPVFVVITIIIGAQAGGILGMIISIPVVCMLKLTVQTIYDQLVEFHT